MISRILTALICWHALASFVWAQARETTVSRPTRLDWEFAAAGFGRDHAADLPADYDSKKQKYQLYAPARYTTTRVWPLIAFISPGDGPVGWSSFVTICQKEGIFFCSPFRAGNTTPPGLRIRIVLDMIDDVRRNYRIDPHQTYIGGFSGGGRMACSIGFALPEVFAGVIPVCGTNPLGTLPYLRLRLVDRVSVAFVTGERDFNRNENEEWMAPYFKELEIRSRLWVAPGVGHDIPRSAVMEEAVTWLAADLKRRLDDAKARPKLNLKFDEAFRGDAQADRLLAAAQSEIQDKQRLWQGYAILHGITRRWPESQSAGLAKDLMQKLRSDQDLSQALSQQRLDDDRKSFTAQARGFERLGNLPKAIEVWEVLARSHPDSALAEDAQAEVRRLQEKKVPRNGPKKKRG